MVNITLHSFHSRFPFDGSGYVKNNLALGLDYLHFPTMEDYWANCENDFEVRRKDWMRFTVRKIIDYKMGWDVTGIIEDNLDLIDPFFFERIQLLELPYINWSLPELKDLKERTFFVIQRTENWLKNKVKEATATRSTGKDNAKKNDNSQVGTSVSAIPSSVPTSSGSFHSTQGGDDGEDPNKRVDLVSACELNIATKKKRSKPRDKALKPIQQMIDEAPKMNTLP